MRGQPGAMEENGESENPSAAGRTVTANLRGAIGFSGDDLCEKD